MRRTGCTLLIVAAFALPAHAQEPQRLTLSDAIRAAWLADPSTAQAQIANERAKLATLRSQLDRVSVKVDGSLQELYNKSNIGGPKLQLCSFGSITLQLDANDCTSMGGTSSTAANSSPSATQGLFNLQAQVTVPVFSGFRVEATVKRNQILERVSSANERQTRRDIALSTMRAYWSVRRLAMMIDAQKAAIDRLRDSEKATEDRVKAGLAPGIDRNRARSRRLAQQSTVIDLVGQLREAEVQLAISLNLNGRIELVDAPVAVAEPNCSESSEIAMKLRPELLRARLTVDAQTQAVRIVRSGYYPQLNGFFLFQYGNNAFSVGSGARSLTAAANPFAGLAGNLTVGGQVTMNFFDMLNTWTAVKDARLEEARLVAETARAKRTVDADVQTACARLQRLVNHRAIQEEARDVAKDNVTILEQRYRNGDALLIELLDSQLELTTAELNLVDLVAQLQPAWLELAAARGLDLVGAIE